MADGKFKLEFNINSSPVSYTTLGDINELLKLLRASCEKGATAWYGWYLPGDVTAPANAANVKWYDKDGTETNYARFKTVNYEVKASSADTWYCTITLIEVTRGSV
jgi:hypothetical protein